MAALPFRSALRGMRFPAAAPAGANQDLALQFQLEQSQWLAPQALLQQQLAQLRTVLDHALRTVPFYGELYGGGVALPQALDLAFVRSLPRAQRAAVSAAGDRLVSSAIPAAHGKRYPVQTSGSTGTPVQLIGTDWTGMLWRALALREHLWHGRDFTRKLGAIRWARREEARPPDGLSARGWGTAVDRAFTAGPACMLNITASLDAQVAWLERERPDYLISFPSNLSALAEYCEPRGISMPWLREIRTVGEMLTDAQRAAYARVWACPVVDVYSSVEAGYLALQCPAHQHYHVQSENVLLEVVDETGRPCAPGETGHVLLTTLHNFATPLIRYELGDLAEVGAPCPCGRGLPVLKRLRGRQRNRLRMPDGRSEFPYLGEHGDIQRATGVEVRKFQVVQRSREQIELKLVTNRPFTAEETKLVIAQVKANLGHAFQVAVTLHEDLPKGPGGKFEEFVSEVRD